MAIGGSGRAGNNGNMFITLKPRSEREASAQQIIARLRPKLEKVEGARLYMQAAQDVRLGGRPTRTQFEFTLQDANLAELNEWAPKILAKMQTLPQLRDVATDQQTQGTTLELKINRDTASRYGITPAADRRHALRCLRPAPGHAIFHPAQQLSRDPGNPARAAGQPRHAEQDLRPLADHRRPGAAVDFRDLDQRRRSGRCRSATRASSRRSPSASTSARAWRWDRRPRPCRRR